MLEIAWRLRAKEKLVKESLDGYFTEFHRSMLESHYKHYRFLTSEIGIFEERLASAMKPYDSQIELLVSIPGMDRLVAWHVIAELGMDNTTFPDADHCASWAGLVPGQNESAGKQKSTRCRKGNRTLRRVLTQAAWAASHCKAGYMPAFFRRVKSRRGWAKAIVATAHKILTIAFHVLRTGTPYRELGHDYFDRLNPARATRNLVARLEALGHHVQLSPLARSNA